MLAAASILAALGGIKPSSEQHQQQQQQQGEEEDEADGLFFSDQASASFFGHMEQKLLVAVQFEADPSWIPVQIPEPRVSSPGKLDRL
eukprot:1141087-Pelagomonas_calceolata.AAC.2